MRSPRWRVRQPSTSKHLLVYKFVIMAELFTPELIVAFLTLTALELVLGIDNIIFISILVDRLQATQRKLARRLGLFLAMFMRIALLSLLVWMTRLTTPLFTLFGHDFGARDLILIAGGIFLVWKSTGEIHHLITGEEASEATPAVASFGAVIAQIIVIDLVFSLDSIITAVGMVSHLPVMVAAVVASVALMMVAAEAIGNFVSGHPTVKMLALSFLMVVGVVLIAEGCGHHVPKGYIYFAMAFSVMVELLNLRMRRRMLRPEALGRASANK